MTRERILELLEAVGRGETAPEAALERLAHLPFVDLPDARVDTHRALRAGLPDIILHGTATLALAVSAVLREHASCDAERVTRVAGRFGAMVRMPSECRVRISAPAEGQVAFEVRNALGETAIRDGLVGLRA